MSWTYSGNPADSDLDMTRFLVGDTDPNAKQLENEELNALLAEVGDTHIAAARAAYGLSAKYARRVTVKTGDVSKTLSDLSKHYRELGASLEAQASDSVSPYAGGLSKAERTEDRQDEDLKQPHVEVGMHDNPRRGNTVDDRGECL